MVKFLHDVNVKKLVRWIKRIDFKDWPQQSKTELRPAMVTDLNWFDFGRETESLVPSFGYNRMLSVVMPGHSIPPHKDEQAPNWLYRVHIPLLTNEQSKFIVEGEDYQMKVGKAYAVNTQVEHSVENLGTTPRVHFMYDVRYA